MRSNRKNKSTGKKNNRISSPLLKILERVLQAIKAPFIMIGFVKPDPRRQGKKKGCKRTSNQNQKQDFEG